MSQSVSKAAYGKTQDGEAVDLYTLTNAHGLVCRVATYGAIITELHAPDRAGRMGDVVMGFDSLGQYLTENPYFGCVCGRVANRIARGRFTLEGKTYHLATNNGPNTLHGGLRGFDKVVWRAATAETVDGPSIVLTHLSPDGDEGFPGNLSVRMAYTLTGANELRIEYRATTDRTTPVNLTNHSYFNLACRGDVKGHVLELNASRYTPLDPGQIPTGIAAEAAGGPLDFTIAKAIGRDIARVPDNPKGYDHNFVINGGGRSMVLAARVHEPDSGRTMEVLTDEPAVQLYTGNNLDGKLKGKKGVVCRPHDAFCLETQHYPDSVNHPSFPSTILRPGEEFRSTTLYRFGAR
ncbi:MAG TPA: aldose epimerase family protein [Opitutaceae bacterium]